MSATRGVGGGRGMSVEDAIKVTENIIGTLTLEQCRRLREDDRCNKHIVKRQPGTSGDVGGDL